MSKKLFSKKEKLIRTLLSGKISRKYQGKHVVIIGNQTVILPKGKEAETIEKLEKKYPREIPELIFVPRPESYILFIL